MEMTDPLGKPVLPTGPEYMDGLARLGYNVETMSSSIPMYTKAAQAATSLMDTAFNQRLAWDKAQADNKEAIARANQIDSITDYNNQSLDLRIKALDQENQQRDLGLAYDKYTLDGREKGFDLQQQLLENRAKADNETIDGKIALAKAQDADNLAEVKQRNEDRLSAQADFTPALSELRAIPLDAPDYDAQMAAWHSRHLTAITNQVTGPKILSEVQSLTNQRSTLTAVKQTAANRTEVNRLLQDHHLPANDNYDVKLRDPAQTQTLLVQGHMSEAVDDIQSLYTVIKSLGKTLPAEYQSDWRDILQSRDAILANQNDEGYAKIVKGGGAGIVTADGHLRKDIQTSVNNLKAYLEARAKQQAIAKPVEAEIKQDPVLGRTITYKNVPAGSVEQYGTNPQATTGTITSQQLIDLANAHPELSDAIHEYLHNKTDGNYKKLTDAITAAQGGKGYQFGGRVGYQSGGQVGAGSVGDPATTAATQFLTSPGDIGFLGGNPPIPVSTDTVPAMLTPGEFVLNRDATRAIGAQNLNAINQAGQKPADTAVAAFSGLSESAKDPDQTPKEPVANTPTPTPESDTGRIKGSNVNNYAYPEGAADVNGIDRNVWTNVMGEEGPDFGMDGKHMSVFGLWKGAPGLEGQAFQTIREHGANSLEAYKAVTDTWDKLFLQQTKPQLLKSPGMQEMVIADSQHAGGKPTLEIIQKMGGWDAINKMPRDEAIKTYSALRTHLWPGNSARVDREREWALKNDGVLSGEDTSKVAGMQSGGMVEGNPLYGPGLGFQHGGFVSGGGGGGFESELEGGGGARVGGGGGFEAGLDQTGGGTEGARQRRFHPRTAGTGGMGAQPNIPDPMQRRVAKLSQDFITGLSSLIKTKPELGGAIMQHAKGYLAATGLGDVRSGGGGGEDFLGGGTRREAPIGMNPAMLAMSGLGGGEGSSSEEAYT